jgi:hypothetical protein
MQGDLPIIILIADAVRVYLKEQKKGFDERAE